MERQEGNVRAVYLGNPTLTRDEFYEFLAHEIGLSQQAQTSKAQFLRELRADLVARHAQGTLTALVIDEAQAMSDALLEELRLLENLETPSEKLLPVVLVGQPELAVRLRQPALLPLRQRVALRFTLSPLASPEVVGYISERIRIAGGDVWSVFTPEAVDAVCQACGGIPRNISVVCDNALVNGYALDEKPIGAAVIGEVCRDFELPLPRGAQMAQTAQPTPPVMAAAMPPSDANAIAVRRADIPVMTNLTISEDATVETLMMEPLPRVPGAGVAKTGAAALLSKVTAPVRSLRSRIAGVTR
jgi:general secretion pathway protein A